MGRHADMGPVLRRAVAAAATLALTAIMCGGCAYVMPTTSLDKTPQDRWYASDIPVPDGFVLDKENSRMFERGHRDLKLVYRRESYVDMDRPWDFYKETLPARGWELKFLFGFDQRGMIFWKGDEELRITLDRNMRHAFVASTIEVEPKDPTGASPVVAKRVE